MNEKHGETGPVIVPTESWELYKERWYEVADLHDSGDVAGAVFQLKRLAGEGFSPALAELGDKYEFGGGGIDVDLAEAVEWYKKSVEAIDDVRSHIGLARIYLQSKELDPDRSLSFYHLKLLAETDTMAGWFGLGFAHQHGIGTDVDLDAAETCFRNAVEKGHLVAGTHLAQVLLANDRPGGFKTGLRFIPRVLWMKLFRPRDPRLGFEYEPIAQE
ncbi:MAG: tetratricopeptide repeat protein [Woeseiaceae bacterium]